MGYVPPDYYSTNKIYGTKPIEPKSTVSGLIKSVFRITIAVIIGAAILYIILHDVHRIILM